MPNKPRIAFCFSWQARTLDQTYLFFQRNLFDAAKEQWFDYDVFCAVEDDEDVNKVKLLNPTKIEKIKSSEVKQIIDEEYPNIIEDFQKKYSFIDLTWKYFLNMLQQFYKVQRSFLLMEYYGNDNKILYDIVVRLRFDFIFFNKINFVKVLNTIRNWMVLCNKYDSRKIFLKIREINDFFFFWNQKSMSALWRLFDDFYISLKWDEVKKRYKIVYNIFEYIKKFFVYINFKLKYWLLPVAVFWPIESCFYKIHTPELIYYQYFLSNNISIIKDSFSYILVRKEIEKSEIKLKVRNEYEL